MNYTSGQRGLRPGRGPQVEDGGAADGGQQRVQQVTEGPLPERGEEGQQQDLHLSGQR